MKTKSFTVSLVVLGTSFSAFADYAALPSQAAQMKSARIQMEVENQNKLMEMLENQRLAEEKVRMARIQDTSFSVRSQPSGQGN